MPYLKLRHHSGQAAKILTLRTFVTSRQSRLERPGAVEPRLAWIPFQRVALHRNLPLLEYKIELEQPRPPAPGLGRSGAFSGGGIIGLRVCPTRIQNGNASGNGLTGRSVPSGARGNVPRYEIRSPKRSLNQHHHPLLRGRGGEVPGAF